ncbi:MAG: hypothetical protein Ct9H300mP25_05450 [Acidobacteriota bacterium]|nr:MAG: hypothetical protein Ct9H300mP25_05450 [Acidobacteriota bacterium]
MLGGRVLYWFDWYFDAPTDIGQPSIIVEPVTGRIPERTADARESVAMNLAQLHDSYANMESGDRCISRGVLGMMMPTEYNNGTLILQPPGYVVIHSEMIHNVRIIPITESPHVDDEIRQWGKGTRAVIGMAIRWSLNRRTSGRYRICRSHSRDAFSSVGGTTSRGAPHCGWTKFSALHHPYG